MPMDVPGDPLPDIHWGNELYIPSLQQLKGEEEFFHLYSLEEVRVIATESLYSEEIGIESPIFWYAFWCFIKQFDL